MSSPRCMLHQVGRRLSKTTEMGQTGCGVDGVRGKQAVTRPLAINRFKAVLSAFLGNFGFHASVWCKPHLGKLLDQVLDKQPRLGR